MRRQSEAYKLHFKCAQNAGNGFKMLLVSDGEGGGGSSVGFAPAKTLTPPLGHSNKHRGRGRGSSVGLQPAETLAPTLGPSIL